MYEIKRKMEKLKEIYNEKGFGGACLTIAKKTMGETTKGCVRIYYLAKLLGYIKIMQYRRLRYSVIGTGRVGFAVRALTVLTVNLEKYLVTADVGDDSLSVLPIQGNRLMKRVVLEFPRMSAPIGVKSIHCGQSDEAADGLLVATFNFDENETNVKSTYVCLFELMAEVIDLAHQKNRVNANEILSKQFILKRTGHWGFRSVNRYVGIDGTNYISATDRSRDSLYVIEIPPGARKIEENYIHAIDLSYETGAAEPIYSRAIPTLRWHDKPLFCVNQRGKNDLTIVGYDGERYEIKKRIDVGGASRSNIAIGHFRNHQQYDIALALWGGDPKDLMSIQRGKVVFIFQDYSQDYTKICTINAGVHPTDVICGDFDGDGIDELAVLNYGSGLTSTDRIHPGGIQIFKYIKDAFVEVGKMNVPHPRIGLAFDIDDDGKDELLVSLFFEKRVIIIKHRD